jgi:tRNA pseudouridine13 synthase
VLNQTTDLFVLENSIIDECELFKKGLIDAGLDYSRRAMRYFAHDLSWTQQGENIELAFTLGRGQFATSLLRELVSAR